MCFFQTQDGGGGVIFFHTSQACTTMIFYVISSQKVRTSHALRQEYGTYIIRFRVVSESRPIRCCFDGYVLPTEMSAVEAICRMYSINLTASRASLEQVLQVEAAASQNYQQMLHK